MQVEAAIRARRTTKAFGADPLPESTVRELLELARWAPNHRLTNPWRFRVVGPAARERLKQADGDPVKAKKLDRAPTLVAVTAASDPDASAAQRAEDLLAAGCAAYIVLLAATDRGLASYWRTPKVLTTDAGRAALGIDPGEQVVALLHLGPARQEQPAPERAPLAAVTTFLD